MRWDERWRRGEHASLDPDPFLVESLASLRPGRALDLACGAGRHALALARAGFGTTAVDFSAEALKLVADRAADAGLEVELGNLDLEADPPPDLGADEYDLVAVFQFLHRPLFPAIRRAVRPGGFVLYKTYLAVPRGASGGPSNPEFRLCPDELRTEFAGWRVLRYEEETAGPGTASLLAQKPL